MKSEDKQAALEGFENTTKSGAVLVSTTVIEVGIDVPDATIILIEDANQFGLSQLHQLRGRVGRSDLQSYCFLMTAPERELTEKAVQRMEAMISTTDGFEISKKDMQIRGTGSIVSESQSGYDGFRIADLRKDKKIAQHAHKAATENPTLAAAQAAQTWFEVDVDLGRIA
jgi:ATP-dependent DNA helicase RecG